jgi:valyl-tRNA synthetase
MSGDDSQKINQKIQTQSELEISPASAWILLEYSKLEQALETNLENFELAHSVEAIYKFLWDYYADWYVEYLKTAIDQIPFAKELFRQFVITLSPYLPFETEALWSQFFGQSSLLAFEIKDLAWTQTQITKLGGPEQTETLAGQFRTVMDFIQDIRSLRGLFAIDPVVKIEVQTDSKILAKYAQFVELNGRATIFDGAVKAYPIRKSDYQYSIDVLSYLPDKQKEVDRTNKYIASLEKQIKALGSQLNNAEFLEKAGPEVIQEKRQNLTDRELEINQQLDKLKYLVKS